MLQDQQVIKEQGKIDYYAAMDFKSWDMLVCSKYDPSIMDAWNSFTTKVEETYSPDYTLNPFPLDVTQLYKMNPQRFLRWMALHRELGNKLLRYFKLSPGDRPDLLQEIARIDDPTDGEEENQYVTQPATNFFHSSLQFITKRYSAIFKPNLEHCIQDKAP